LKKYLLDTNAVIYALNEGFLFPAGDYLISVISEIELFSYSKLTKDEEEALADALSNFSSIELTKRIKDKTIEIRKIRKLKLPDCIIVATAIVNEAILVTSDKQLLNLEFLETTQLSELK
jgi:predicted nucleic acid-binding protein